jgi:hypothetical protein
MAASRCKARNAIHKIADLGRNEISEARFALRTDICQSGVMEFC